MQDPPGSKIISSILKHDSKQTSYKIALVRAINDIALSYPEMNFPDRDIAVPLRLIAEFWLAYYYPFVDPVNPIYQGARATRAGKLSNDISFRHAITHFRELWQHHYGGIRNPADGFYAINELRLPRNQATYPPDLHAAYISAVKAIARTVEMPIRYAGPSGLEWSVFDRPRRFSEITYPVFGIPGTQHTDTCLIIKRELWQAFRTLSMWIEALCIHEWCLFTERISQTSTNSADRGEVYHLLTARPDNRRPLTWERNQVDLLLLEGHEFRCPWTQTPIRAGIRYDLDHILPMAVYPINELWNLVPADPEFNSHKKRDRLPSLESMKKAEYSLNATYSIYSTSRTLASVLREDVYLRFGMELTSNFSSSIVLSVKRFIQQIGEARNLAQF